MRKIKSYLESTTIKFVLLGCIGGLIPIVNDIRERRSFEIWDDGMRTFIVLLSSIGAIKGRIDADSRLYTPDNLPGPNKQELVIDNIISDNNHK